MVGKKEDPVKIIVDRVMIEGNLQIPSYAKGLVLFAHGSGSSRHSPRNKTVAMELQEGGLATLLLDLLTPEEEIVDNRSWQYRFDIDLLANRIIGAVDWLTEKEQTRMLNIGIFGSSTGAAAAFIAAAKRPDEIKAIVSRGGKSDLAVNALPKVKAPTLFIAGEKDTNILQMNRESMKLLNVENRLEIIPGATHLFVELGALKSVAVLAGKWLRKFLTDQDNG